MNTLSKRIFHYVETREIIITSPIILKIHDYNYFKMKHTLTPKENSAIQSWAFPLDAITIAKNGMEISMRKQE